jgi:hypothetical protein
MANKRIQDLPALTPATTLILPVTNGATTGRITVSEVCGVITSGQISSALGYTPVGSVSPSVAKAWVTFRTNLDVNGTSSTAATNRFLIASYNVGSVTRNAAGVFTVNFSPFLPTNNYSIQVTAGYATDNITTGGGGHFSVPVAGYKLTNPSQSCQVGTWDDSTNAFSSDFSGGNSIVNVAIFHN